MICALNAFVFCIACVYATIIILAFLTTVQLSLSAVDKYAACTYTNTESSEVVISNASYYSVV